MSVVDPVEYYRYVQYSFSVYKHSSTHVWGEYGRNALVDLKESARKGYLSRSGCLRLNLTQRRENCTSVQT